MADTLAALIRMATGEQAAILRNASLAKHNAITVNLRLNWTKLVAVVVWMADRTSFDQEWNTVEVSRVALGELHCGTD